MSERTGHQGRPGQRGLPCPECGALRAPDNTPSCTCAQRAADALRDTRTAEAAAAEDFDPLRIRPYVELGDAAGEGPDATMQLRAVQARADETVPLQRVRPGDSPATTDLSLFEAGDGEGADEAGGLRTGDGESGEAPSRGRRRRTLLIAATAAAVAVVAAAGFAGGLFSYESPTRDSAAPKDVRAAVPDTSTSAASESADASRSASPSTSSASPPPFESTRSSPSEPETSSSPTVSATATASATAPTARATGTLEPDDRSDDSQETITPPVLRLGDQGTEVTELQLRLHQLYLYNGEADGTFSSEVETSLRNYQWSRGIQDDELGVYGAATRAKLESETKEP
ncbi:peptidoglycan-binding domain-containing protein [Streptomyces sp. NPDC002588]|uniref:peptidoglycan-binding domain-containing protein n=1 Tax=Streptomyces sp. NPDC002588 TaxID=3154419 RepID=UPI00332C6001